MIHERILNEHQKIQKQIHDLQTQIAALPEGKLVCSRSGNSTKWYKSIGCKKIYIPKADRKLAEQLAIKKYLKQKLLELQSENTAINFYLRHHSGDLREFSKSDLLLINDSGYKELLAPYFKPVSLELAEWMHAPYEHNPNYPEKLIHQTASGNLVRSKSEAMIDLCLYKNRIPFRYECALQLGDVTLYPDFTIRHPKTGETYYYEHFGWMDDPNYSHNAFRKMELYTAHGIYPSIRLLTTFENKKHPLNFKNIENIISFHFCKEDGNQASISTNFSII